MSARTDAVEAKAAESCEPRHRSISHGWPLTGEDRFCGRCFAAADESVPNPDIELYGAEGAAMIADPEATVREALREFASDGEGLDAAILDAFLAERENAAARQALTDLAEHIDQTASHIVGIRVHSQKAQSVLDFRDKNFPQKVTDDA